MVRYLMTHAALKLFMTILATTVLGSSGAQAGDFNVDLRIGNTSIRAGDGGFSARASFGSRAYHRGTRGFRRHAYEGNLYKRERYKRRDRFKDRRGDVIIVPVRERTIVRERPAEPEVVVIERPVPQPAPVEPVVLDPQGVARVVPARGRAVAPVVYELGSVLPPDQPHVTLDHRRYGLPTPPVGQIYARLGRDVLRIDAATRQVMAVVAK